MLKAAVKTFCKIIVSGITAFVILTTFCCFYCNILVNTINIDDATDVKCAPNSFYCQANEGFAWGKKNNDGFTNLFDYDDDTRIDILVMGSSHMEAHNVQAEQCVASRLDALLENETVYNIGASSHYFLICASHLRAALNKYQPSKYVVIETMSVSFSDNEIALAISEEAAAVSIPSRTGKIYDLLKENPYIMQTYSQIKSYLTKRQAEYSVETETLNKSEDSNNENLLNDLFYQMSGLADEYGTKIIIAYHPGTSVSPDGTLTLNNDEKALAQVKRLCDANGIRFLDMSDRFKEEYEASYILPHGFSNTTVGGGHLNKYGHSMMAEELYNLILEDEQ